MSIITCLGLLSIHVNVAKKPQIVEHIFILSCFSLPNSSSWHNLLHTWGHTSFQLFYIHPINHFLALQQHVQFKLFFFHWGKAICLNKKYASISYHVGAQPSSGSGHLNVIINHQWQKDITAHSYSHEKRRTMLYRNNFIHCSDICRKKTQKGINYCKTILDRKGRTQRNRK